MMAEWISRWCEIGQGADDWGEGYYEVLAGQVVLDRLALIHSPLGYYRIMAWLRNGHRVEVFDNTRGGKVKRWVLIDKQARYDDWDLTHAAGCMIWGSIDYPEVIVERRESARHLRHWVIKPEARQ